MKRKIHQRIQSLLLMCLLMLGTYQTVWADAIADWYPEEQSVAYDVQVSAPDGGVNLRYAPGVEYDILLDGLIPNGTILHVTREAAASNGNYWGYTVYNGIYGWIALSQVSRIEAAPAVQEVYLGGGAVNYNVEVSAPDGGVNLRFGPGTEYDIRVSMIPNTTVLLVTSETPSSTGSIWGYTSYNGLDGWIALSQVTQLPAPTATPQATVPPTATPTQEATKTPTSTPTATPTKKPSKKPTKTQTATPTPTEALQKSEEAGITISYALLTKLLVVLCILLVLTLTAVLILFKKSKK